MSSERIHGLHSFACDTCPEFIETQARDFSEALAAAKGEGWVAYNVDGVWCHACPGCKERR